MDSSTENTIVNSEANKKIVILDTGVQYTLAIDRKIRELDVECDLMPINVSTATIKERGYKAIIIAGGPHSMNKPKLRNFNSSLLKLGLPVLGISKGMQIINKEFGGEAAIMMVDGDDVIQRIDIDSRCVLFKSLNATQTVLLRSGNFISRVADIFKVIATTSDNKVVAIGNDSLKMYGLHFNPEANTTKHGSQMLKTFLYDIVGLTGKYTVKLRIQNCIEYIRKNVGQSKVLAMLSGGINSTVCAALLQRALNREQVIFVHIDTGFLRSGESQQVVESLKALGLDVNVVQAKFQFKFGKTVIPDLFVETRTNISKPLCQVIFAEEKKKIIGETFTKTAKTFIETLNLLYDDMDLVIGSLKPDLTDHHSILFDCDADTYMLSDHKLIYHLREKEHTIEPIKEFYRDEVKKVGIELGLSESIVHKHPFPGPGLAIRILCGEEAFIDDKFRENQVLAKLVVQYNDMFLSSHSLLNRVESVTSHDERMYLQEISFLQEIKATILPIRSMGIRNGSYIHTNVIGISCTNPEPMWGELYFMANVILRVCPTINRVCYIAGPPIVDQVLDITQTCLTSQVIDLLAEADRVVNEVLSECPVSMRKVSQMPVVLIPIHFDRDVALDLPSCQRSVVIRPFITDDFKIGTPAMPGQDIPTALVQKMMDAAKQLPGISRVLYDLTPKPPATIEWE